MWHRSWPLIRQATFRCPVGLPRLLCLNSALSLAQQHDWSNKTAVRIVVYDKTHGDAKRERVAPVDAGTDGVLPSDLNTFVLDWRDCAGWFLRHPGIDIVIIEPAAVVHAYSAPRQRCFHYACVLALLHMRRWVSSYPCELLVLFDRRRVTHGAIGEVEPTQAHYYRPFEALVKANNGVLVVSGPRTLHIGNGFRDLATLRERLDGDKKLFILADPDSTLVLCSRSLHWFGDRIVGVAPINVAIVGGGRLFSFYESDRVIPLDMLGEEEPLPSSLLPPRCLLKTLVKR
eukprot:jgi/Mesvir1/25155/Mv18835-RA.1